MTIEERLKQAEAQLAYWQQQLQNAQQQMWMWMGARDALAGIAAADEAEAETDETEE